MTWEARTMAPELPGLSWLRTLGSGGFADVHLYRQQLPSREVAVKVLRSREAAAGLQQEANAMAAVAGHPAIVTLHSTGTTDDWRDYLVMEYCPISSLGKQVRQQAMAVTTALETIIPICGGVEMLHRAGWVHRDIKPSNIMLTSFRAPVLGDFGIAACAGDAKPPSGCSVMWASPEQLDGKAATPQHDVWSLAATLWTMVAGQGPFEVAGGDNSPSAVAHRSHDGQLTAMPRPDVPPMLVEVLVEAMHPDPSARIASAELFGRRLNDVQARLLKPVTRMELTGPTVPAGDAQPMEVDPDATIRRPVPEPQRIPTAPDDDDATRMVGTAKAPEPAPAGPPWRWLLIGAVAVLLAVGITATVLLGSGHTRVPEAPVEVQPADPVAAPPPPPTDLRGEIRGASTTWSWRHGEAGTRFFYTVTLDGEEQLTERTTLTSITLPTPKGSQCLEVVAVTGDGRQSAPATACAKEG